jgi:hypothetical protein
MAGPCSSGRRSGRDRQRLHDLHLARSLDGFAAASTATPTCCCAVLVLFTTLLVASQNRRSPTEIASALVLAIVTTPSVMNELACR